VGEGEAASVGSGETIAAGSGESAAVGSGETVPVSEGVCEGVSESDEVGVELGLLCVVSDVLGGEVLSEPSARAYNTDKGPAKTSMKTITDARIFEQHFISSTSQSYWQFMITIDLIVHQK
jgi:hypothetical protein